MAKTPPWEEEGRGPDPQVAAAAADPVARAQLVKALGHKSPSKRAEAAHVLGSLPQPSVDVLAALVARIRRERTAPVKAGLCLAIGALEARAGTRTHRELIEGLTGDIDDLGPRKPPAEVCAAATVALAWMAPVWLTLSMLERLRRQTTLELDPDTFPWSGGKLGEVREALERLWK